MTKPKILIVDDEPFNVDYLEQELAEAEYETTAASDGREALEKIQAESPDLVLLDIMMPVMDGFAVLARLKTLPSARDIPVIVISASNDLNSVVKGIQLGAEDYLPKPFEPVLLHARISSSLEKKRLRDLQKLYLKSLERELEIGRNIQKGFLPLHLPRAAGWEIAAHFKAAHEVAGDFYDAFFLPDGNLLCTVGDVCDKGVGAALFMTLFRSLIRVTSTTDIASGGSQTSAIAPAERLRHIISFTNDYIADTHCEANMFATLFVGIIDIRSGTLTYVNGGNEPPLILRSDLRVDPLPPTGPVAGLFPNASFAIKETALEKGDLFLACTDGIPDSRNLNNEIFGRQRLIALLRDRTLSASALTENIQAELQAFIGAADPFDDITLLVIKRNS